MKPTKRISLTRKKLSNELHEGERIHCAYCLAKMARLTLSCAERLTGDRYGEIAKMCGKSKAWWALAGQKQWSRIKPTPTEYRAIELLHKALTKFGGDTRGRRDLALRILEDMAALQNDIAALMRAA